METECEKARKALDMFCTLSRGLVDLAENLVLAFSRGPLDLAAPAWPLSFLKGCASVEEMMVRLTVEG